MTTNIMAPSCLVLQLENLIRQIYLKMISAINPLGLYITLVKLSAGGSGMGVSYGQYSW